MLNQYQNKAGPYPVDALPLQIRSAVQEVLRHTQAPDALVAMEFLSAMSACAQALYDYESPTGAIRPVSLNIAVIADSGERKTSVHNIVAKPLYDFDELRSLQYKLELKEYDARQQIWTTINNGYHRRLKKHAENQEHIEDLLQKILEHDSKKPVKPRLRRFIRQNITQRAFMEALDGDGEAIACISDEGEVVIKGGLFGFQGVTNKSWDGAAMLTMDRSDGVSIVARNPRVAVTLLVQHSVFKTLNEKRGEQLRGSGYWARYLIGWPESTQGSRYTNTLEYVWNFLPQFHMKMKEVLEEHAARKKSGNNERTILEFADDAKNRYLGLINKTEELICPWGYFNDIKDAASKGVEIMTRLAALLHVFCGEQGKISLNTLNSAVNLYDWHAGEFKRIFSAEMTVTPAVAGAQTLEQYLLRTVWSSGYSVVKKNYVRNHGPIRSKDELNAALEVLCERGAVWIGKGHNQTFFVNLIPTYFSRYTYGMI